MATEAEVKAQERRELLNDIRSRNAARAKADESVRAADQGQYPGVDPVEKGPFDDEMNQESKDILKNIVNPQGGDVSKLDFSTKGMNALMRRRFPGLILADVISSNIPAPLKKSIGTKANELYSGIFNKAREALGFESQYVMNADGTLGFTGAEPFQLLKKEKLIDGGKGSIDKRGRYIRKTDKIKKYNVLKDKVNDIYENPSKYNLDKDKITNVGVLKIVNKHLNDMGIDSSSESAVNRVLIKLRGVQKGSESNILKRSSRFFFNKIKMGEKITSDAMPTVKFSTIFDDTGKTFSQTRSSFLNNNVAKSIINKTKNLFKDKSSQLFDVDHIQAPRFGGTNSESNLRLITKADHTSLKTLPTSKTLATDVVKNKTSFEDEYYKLSTKLIDNIKNDNYVAADKIAESLRVLTNNFKSTYKNVDFVVGQPHVVIKTGKNAAKYIKYGDDIKLSNKQKKYIEDNNLLPEQSNLPNAGKSIEKQAEDIYNGYLQMYNLIGEIPSEAIIEGSTIRKSFSRMRDGGIVSYNHLTRPLGNF